MVSEKPLNGKIILLTGASRGIGRAAAIACANAGAELIITGRTTGALEEVDDEIQNAGSKATIVELDSTDLPAIPRLAKAIHDKWGRLDGFIANAGQLGQMSPMPHIEADAWDQTILVNLTAVWHQIRSFDPLLRVSPAARVILMSSAAAVGPRPYWGAYAVSKAGVEAMGRAWAAENEQTEMKINMIDPGGTRTSMRAAAFPGEDPLSLPTPEDIAPAFVALMRDDCPHHGELVKARSYITS
ncbi:SDR family NAD(P)-dependent oxidoreductase [Alphaproteobacteria bacterium]|jgi:NAD(P)-dependent dehydrogenase (short-subunit alcohol dehydrogenase family)|nr:SDR family NAD(P)-dependent oxidoreductase [Alphaproteobacteria bacterium]MBT5798455.1 SDR family NAD(P)-dependent oxidoreductase [Alphaproteobacteria bacterium]MDA9815992.1 SDR family NAD(P)-dependent oxidoreductase [Alphaproteobacteria bacterium]MDC0394783.1 SDR family NAD(P)-dependent oxidoreductase [Alphaproteobacteria bacterium]MDC0461458.1 SDR family NAD(P)-dependent oxidoreductase [Alphaproteobacteria bacterium]